jgi:hypothetical protein
VGFFLTDNCLQGHDSINLQLVSETSNHLSNLRFFQGTIFELEVLVLLRNIISKLILFHVNKKQSQIQELTTLHHLKSVYSETWSDSSCHSFN